MTSLQIAAGFGDEGLIRCLLQDGHNPNVVEASFCAPLRSAVCWGSSSAVEALLDHGACIELACRNGETALHAAVRRDSTEMLELLLRRGGDSNYKSSRGETLLFYAMSAKSIETARVLLRNKANPNIPDDFGVTPLFQCIVDQHNSFIDLLLENGADPNAMVKMKQTSSVISPGSVTTSNGNNSNNVLVRTTTVVPVPLGPQSEEAEITHSPIYWAVLQGYETPLQSLLSACESITWEDLSHNGESLLHYAVRLHTDRIFRILLERGPEKLRCSTNSDGETPLHTAAVVGNMAAATMLVNVGCQIDHRSCAESTPLTNALLHGHLEIAHLLLQHGADRSVADEFIHGQLDGRGCIIHVGARNASGLPAVLAKLPRLSAVLESGSQDLAGKPTRRWMEEGIVGARRKLGRLCWQVLTIYVLSLIARKWRDIYQT
ncbi:ankyrin repeat-containing domain protein [Xylaria castorea]|nr:ankyrin repeat-containing domain protein [Xylaria castorea]